MVVLILIAFTHVGCSDGSGGDATSGSNYSGGGDSIDIVKENYGQYDDEIIEEEAVPADPMMRRDIIVIYRNWSEEHCDGNKNTPILGEDGRDTGMVLVLTRVVDPSTTCETFGKKLNGVSEDGAIECMILESGQENEMSCAVGFDYTPPSYGSTALKISGVSSQNESFGEIKDSLIVNDVILR